MKLLNADSVTLGFIGLGNMGQRIAQRLLDHGYELFVYDRGRAKTDRLAAQTDADPERLVIPYPYEQSLRFLIAAPCIIAAGFFSRDEAEPRIRIGVRQPQHRISRASNDARVTF